VKFHILIDEFGNIPLIGRSPRLDSGWDNEQEVHTEGTFNTPSSDEPTSTILDGMSTGICVNE
jgi:hypothetical protein